MAKSIPLVLSTEDHDRLESIVRTRTLQAQIVTRARILLLKENEGSLYRQDLLYKTNAGKLDRCIADSIAFISECNEKGGIYKIYSKECSPQTTLEASCIAKVSNETTLKTIANTLKAECEAFVTNLPEAEPIPTVHCQGDSENGMTCDTTWNQ